MRYLIVPHINMARIFVCVLLGVPLVSTLLFDGSCRGRCHKYVANSVCFCNDQCARFGDCCSDYKRECGTCAGKCHNFYDSALPCQCNDLCSQYSNCCGDYKTACPEGGSSASSALIAETLWKIDVDRFEPDEITVNYGPNVDVNGSFNQTSQPLFTKVDESRFTYPSYKTFIALINSYDPPTGQTSQSLVDAFLDALFTSEVTRTAHAHLLKNNYIKGNLSDYRRALTNLWFKPYTSSGSTSNTTGFQTMVLGRQGGSSNSGPHNWVRFYLEEKAGRIGYWGYTKKTDFLVEAVFTMPSNTRSVVTSFFLGSSPMFDINLSSICALSNTTGTCSYNINSTPFRVVTHRQGIALTEAYPAL
ncbi:uridylate-specific endoribonuclease-like [Haliotis rufescens]|uniref:uridylate-specific endoribonuclease-like n=1 Tax=Haliotis rufescens TaxID=6454 RepID=UPI00201E7C13|nr:uridylate-specific endoribonuclease-like [Haliotis rufescens]